MLLLFLQLATAVPAKASPSPAAAVTREAQHVLERGDSATVQRWRAAAPHDRLAALGLATLARLTYRYDEADSGFARLYAGGANDDVARYALMGGGWDSDERGDPTRSDSLFVRARAAAHAAHDSAAEGEAIVGLTIGRAARHGVPLGLSLLAAAERLVGDDAWMLAEIAARRALLFAVTRDSGAAAESRRGVELARRGGNLRAEAGALRAHALDQWVGGQDDSSLVTLAAVEQVEIAAHDRSALAVTLLRNADVYCARGELGACQVTLERAMAEGRASNSAFAINAGYTGIATIALQTRDYAGAARALDSSARGYEAQHDTASRMNVADSEARLALATGRLDSARAIAIRLRDFHHRLHDARAESDILRTLVAIERRAGRLDAADHWLAAARTIDREQTKRHELDYDAASIALARGDAAGAARLLRRFIAGIDTSDHVGRHGARELLATALVRMGDVDGAEREMMGAEREVDAWRGTLSDRALRLLAFQVWSRDAEVGAPAATAIVVAALVKEGRTDAAFAIAERRRARELADALARATATAPTTGDSTARARRIVGAEPASAETVAAALLDSHSALLEYVTGAGDAPTTVLAMTRGADGRAVVRGAVLGASDSTAAEVARFAALLESGAPGADRAATSLGRALLAPGVDSLPSTVDRLIIVADGALHRLAFDALRTGDGRWVAERWVTSIAPSATVAVELRRRAPATPPRPGRLLAFGDPAFGARDTLRLAPLPASGAEARDIARYAPDAVVRLGAAASAEFLRHAPLASFDVIHFATHALVDDRSPTRSALALAPSAGESGLVSAGELGELRLGARLVVLSACSTAGGVVVDGEGVQGLTAPLLAAGAGAVVATQWPVDDRATAAFVHDLYDAMARGLPVGDALRSARRAAIARGAPVQEWGAFTLVGDPMVRVALREPSSARRWWLAALALLVVLPVAGAGYRRVSRGRATMATGTRR